MIFVTYYCYSEVFRSSHQSCSLKNTFSTDHLQTTASEFLQKDIDKFIECQTNERTKEIHIRRKKAKHGTEGNELKCQLLKT